MDKCQKNIFLTGSPHLVKTLKTKQRSKRILDIVFCGFESGGDLDVDGLQRQPHDAGGGAGTSDAGAGHVCRHAAGAHRPEVGVADETK